MESTMSFGDKNSGFQAAVINGNVTAQFLQSESLNQVCLRDLRTTNPHDDKDRIQKTNGGLIKDCYRWIIDNEQFKQWQDTGKGRLWIRGDPGKGKTMLLCGIIDELTQALDNNTNISFFFCQAADVRINHATAVLRGLIYSLVEKQPSLLSHVRRRYDKAGKTLFEDTNAGHALSKIFTDILNDESLRETYFLVDALDECTSGLSFFLRFMVWDLYDHSKVKWIITSRNWPLIEEYLSATPWTTTICLEFHGQSISEAVHKFIQHRIHHLAKVKKYGDETRDAISCYLLSNSQGTFLWIALICERLERTSISDVSKVLQGIPPELKTLYGRMIDHVLCLEDADVCKQILAVMCIVYRPVTLDELVSVAGIPNDLAANLISSSDLIARCGSFLTLQDGVVTFIHQSAKEFLLTEARDDIFTVGIEAEHRAVFLRSINVMSKTLRRDIFQLGWPGFPIEKVIPPNPNPLANAIYACDYWVDHLQDSWCTKSCFTEVCSYGCVDAFFRQKFLQWLEALSIIRRLSNGIAAMTKLESLFQQCKDKQQFILYQVQDALRFIRYHKLGIEKAPLQVYSSGLTFSPKQSILKTFYQQERPYWVLNEPLVEEDWTLCIHTLEGHNSQVNTISWSPDGNLLASASYDTTVRIWDSATGQCVSILRGHDGPVNTISWRVGGRQLASGSSDKTVRIWDSATSDCVSIIKGHSDTVWSISWSPNGNLLASASSDRTLRVWDLATSQHMSTLEGHSGSVSSIAWSPDGNQIVSSSHDKTIILWNVFNSKYTSRLQGHSDWVSSVVWSKEGSRVASASYDKTVRIWELATGKCVRVLEGHTHWVNSIMWSPDESRLATGSCDGTVTIWNQPNGVRVLTVKGHNGPVYSIAWSPDGSRIVSGSSDKTIKIWDKVASGCDSLFKRPSYPIYSVIWSPDGSQLASISSNAVVNIWNPATGKCVLMLKGHEKPISSIAWSPDGSEIASASYDRSVRIWDSATGQCLSIIDAHSSWVGSLIWSQDGRKLASRHSGRAFRIRNPATDQCEIVDTLKINQLNTSTVTSGMESRDLPMFNPHSSPALCRQFDYCLSDDHSWVTYKGFNLLWLPTDYRPSHPSLFATFASTVAIGCSSGRVIFLALSELNSLSMT